MVERLRAECIQCLLNQQLDKVPEDTPNETRVNYMQAVLKRIGEATIETSAPVLVREISGIQKEIFGCEYDYSQIKKHFNQVMLEKEGSIAQKIENAKDSLKCAIQYSMTGNYIDFGAMKNVDEVYLDELLNRSEENIVNPVEYQSLQKDLAEAEQIAFLTDNCGEIVLDKLLIKEIQKKFPSVKLQVIVRGGEVLNDATITDARQIGMEEIVPVIANGNNIAGTCLEELSEEAYELLHNADVILAKGQANYETLRKCGLNIYYIFMCKCDLFAKTFQVPKYTGMLINERHCRHI